MTVQHCLISQVGLGVCAAWAMDVVIARDITIYTIFTEQQFVANKHWKFNWSFHTTTTK